LRSRERRIKEEVEKMPSFISLFEMFWHMVMLMKRIEENNHYNIILDVDWRLLENFYYSKK
jgi:hypothetical protein